MMTKKEALIKLAESEGLSEEELFAQATFDSIAPGICLACGYTTTVEPDQDKGYCEVCRANTVQSCLVLANII